MSQATALRIARQVSGYNPRDVEIVREGTRYVVYVKGWYWTDAITHPAQVDAICERLYHER